MMRTLAALLVLASAGAAQDDEARITKLIQELGADDYKVREAAEQELKRIGAPAVPALKKALEDKDAERVDRARRILADVEKAKPESKKPAPAGGVRLSVRSGSTKFELYPDGKVELTVAEEDKETGKKAWKTYKADSMEQFREKHPDIAKQHDIERFVPRVVEPGEFDKWWQDWRKRLDEDLLKNRSEWFKEWRWPVEDDFEKFFEEQKKMLEELRRRRFPGSEEEPKEKGGGGREFGIKVEPVSEVLAAQLDLKDGEGVQVAEVKPGSVAEKAGLRKHDVVLKLNAKAITDKWQFRKDVRELVGKAFELEIVRAGKRETLKVKAEE